MQDESHKNDSNRKVRLSRVDNRDHASNVVCFGDYRPATSPLAAVDTGTLYDDLSALAVDMARLRAQVQVTYDRFITICSALDARD